MDTNSIDFLSFQFGYLKLFLQHNPTMLSFQKMHVEKLCNDFDFSPEVQTQLQPWSRLRRVFIVISMYCAIIIAYVLCKTIGCYSLSAKYYMI